MRSRVEKDALEYKLNDEELKELFSSLGKGVISLKANKNDAITELALALIPMFKCQYESKDVFNQRVLRDYRKANNAAKKALKEIKNVAIEVEKSQRGAKDGQ